MESKLIKQWLDQGLSPSRDFEFFARRDNIVIGKLKGKEAVAEYECPYCSFYGIKKITLEKGKKKYNRLKFKCDKCGKTILLRSLKK